MRRFKSEFDASLYDGFFIKNLEQDFNERFRSWHFRGSTRGIQVCTDENYKDKDAIWDWIVFFVPHTLMDIHQDCMLSISMNMFHQMIDMQQMK